jgi:hypothetical protein
MDNIHNVTDRIRVRRRFADLADTLPGEGFADDEITDALIRAACSRFDNCAEAEARIAAIVDQWFAPRG